MDKIRNHAKERLQRGDLILGHNIRYALTSEVAAICRRCGYHYMWLDDEHSPKDPQLWMEIALAGIRQGVTPFMRIRNHDAADISLHVTNGALTVVVPHVNTAEQAKAIARASRFYPRGDQSVPGFFPQIDYRTMSAAEATSELNDAIMVVAMIEHEEAVDNADEIAAVDGIDILYVGLTDLSYDMKIPSQYGDDRITKSIKRVCEAAKRHGKWVGVGGPGPDKMHLWESYVRLGAQMILTQNDISMLVSRGTEVAKLYQGLKPDLQRT